MTREAYSDTWRKIVQQWSKTSNAHFYFTTARHVSTAQHMHNVQSQQRLSDKRGSSLRQSVHVHCCACAVTR